MENRHLGTLAHELDAPDASMAWLAKRRLLDLHDLQQPMCSLFNYSGELMKSNGPTTIAMSKIPFSLGGHLPLKPLTLRAQDISQQAMMHKACIERANNVINWFNFLCQDNIVAFMDRHVNQLGGN